MHGTKVILVTARVCKELGIELQEVWVSYSGRVVYTIVRDNMKKQGTYFYNRMMGEQEMYDALLEAFRPLANDNTGFVPWGEFVPMGTTQPQAPAGDPAAGDG